MSLWRERLALTVMSGFVVCANPGHADVKISTKATSNMSCSGGVCSPTRKKANLNVTELANMLASGDVTLKSESLAQDIEIDAALTWTSTHRLTLDSFQDIAFYQPVTVASAGGLTLITHDGGENGDFRFFGKARVEFWDTSSGLSINFNNYRLVSRLKDLRELVRHNNSGYFALSKNMNAGKRLYTKPPMGAFGGILEGLGNSISHLTIQSNGGENHQVGLFSEIFSGGIHDLKLTEVDIVGTAAGDGVGAFAGASVGSIVNSYVSGTISGMGDGAYVGALVGSTGGTIMGCGSDATILVGDSNPVSGGLVGQNGGYGIITASYAAGSVSGGQAGGGWSEKPTGPILF